MKIYMFHSLFVSTFVANSSVQQVILWCDLCQCPYQSHQKTETESVNRKILDYQKKMKFSSGIFWPRSLPCVESEKHLCINFDVGEILRWIVSISHEKWYRPMLPIHVQSEGYIAYSLSSRKIESRDAGNKYPNAIAYSTNFLIRARFRCMLLRFFGRWTL